jgi:PAS domain S-box-containing protein
MMLEGQYLDFLPVAVFACDGDARIVRFNTRAVELWGREPAPEDRYCGSLRMSRPDGLPVAREESPMARALRTGEMVRDVEVVLERPNGTHTTIRATAVPMLAPDGHVVGAVGTYQEVTPPRGADVEHARLAAIIDSSDDAIVGKTLEGVITSWNRGAEGLFGYTAAEAIGQHISLIIPADRRGEEDEVLARLRRGEKVDHFETVRQTKDGRFIDISLTVSPIRNADGRIVGASKVARNITERRQASLAVADSRRRYHRIFETAGVSLWEEDFTAVKAAIDDVRASGVRDLAAHLRNHPEFVEECIRLVRIVDVNESTLQMFGARSKDELGGSLATIFDTRTREAFAAALMAIDEGKTRFETETVLRTVSGERLDALVSVTFPPPGHPLDSVLVSLTDITFRKQAEQALEESEALFHEIADTAPAMLWISDPNGACTFLSRRWYDFTGQTPVSALGPGWLGALHPHDRRRAREAFLEAKDRQTPVQFECRLKRAEGDYRWTISTGQPRLGVHGEFLGYVGSVIDITERRAAEDAVREEVQIRETLARVGAALAAELDSDKLVQAVTDAATILTSAEYGAFFYNDVADGNEPYRVSASSGAPKEAFSGLGTTRAIELFAPAFGGEAVVRVGDVMSDTRGEGEAATVDGRPLRSGLAVPVVSRAGQGVLFFGHSRRGVFLPRHEQLAAGIASWAALALANARLYENAQEANRSKDAFLATLSHELRTPLNAMLGWSHMLRSAVLPAETQRRGLEALERNARAQAQLVDDLLDVSRVAAGKLRIRADDVDLASVISSAADTVRPAAAAKALDLRVAVDPETQIIVTGDADRLRQVLWNLLSNAVKFTPRGGRIDVELRSIDGTAEVVVRDTGQGIDADFLREVFEPFRQADSTAARRHGGLGLGLAIVHHLTEAHGGTVVVDSPGAGQGAVFSIRLPIRSVERRGDATPDRGKRQGTALAGLHVLVVDDESDAREMLRTLLETEGASVVAVASAGEALDVLTRRSINVLLADIGLPEQDGYALIQAVRGLPPSEGGTIPAVAVTAYVSMRERDRALESGYGWHVAKPVDPDQLIAVVSTAAQSFGSSLLPSSS